MGSSISFIELQRKIRWWRLTLTPYIVIIILGRGDFWVSSKQTTKSNFFVVVHKYADKEEYKVGNNAWAASCLMQWRVLCNDNIPLYLITPFHSYIASISPHTQTKGVAEYTVDVPIKPPLLATIKSNNYLLNALTCEASQDKVTSASFPPHLLLTGSVIWSMSISFFVSLLFCGPRPHGLTRSHPSLYIINREDFWAFS